MRDTGKWKKRTENSNLIAGAIDGLLGGSRGMDSGHQSLHDAKLVIYDLDQGGQAVGRAGGVADDRQVLGVLVLVDTQHKHGSIGGGGRDDYLGSSSALNMDLR